MIIKKKNDYCSIFVTGFSKLRGGPTQRVIWELNQSRSCTASNRYTGEQEY